MAFRLTRRLVLEGRTSAEDGSGGRVEGWVALGECFAQLEARSGRYELGEGFPRSRVPYRITVRATAPDAPSRPVPGQRFREGNRAFLIRAVADADPGSQFLHCYSDEELVA